MEELLQKIQELQAGHADLKEEISTLMHSKPKIQSEKPLFSSGHSSNLTDEQYLNILQSMGQSVHIVDVNYRLIYWNRSAENLYGYSAAEALGRSIVGLIVDHQDGAIASDILSRTKMGESWTGQFPVRDKMGNRFLIIATTSRLYDDDGTVVGVIVVTSDTRNFEEVKVPISDPKEPEASRSLNQPRKSVATKLGLDPEQPLQNAIASKLTILASKVTDKVRSKLRTGDSNVFGEGGSGDNHHSDHSFPDAAFSDHREDGCSSGASTPRGDPVGAPQGVFSHTLGKSPTKSQRESSDETEGKIGIKMLTSKAEAWLGKKKKQWSRKGNEQETSEARSRQFVWPWLKGQQDSDQPNSAVKPESQTVECNQPVGSDAYGSWSSLPINSSSSPSSCGSSSSSVVNKLDIDTDSLDYEIMWEDLTVEEQIGQGSCGTVYHGFWYGSDVAVKVFSKQEYSDDAILSFRQEVCLMKRLRHPNILLFMGAVTSPERLCIVTEFLPRGSLFRLLQKSTSKLDWRRRIHMAVDVARGMNYLHNCNPPVIHRDLKSSNLLVDKNWTVKVADFGLSRVKHETYLASKTGKGTPQWMAPEVLRNGPSDEKSDIYSFGVVLWELTTQKIPWDDRNAMQVIGAVAFMNQRLEIPNDVDPRWASLIESCFDSEPRQRPTFQELLERLKDLQRQYTIEFQAGRAGSTGSTQQE